MRLLKIFKRHPWRLYFIGLTLAWLWLFGLILFVLVPSKEVDSGFVTLGALFYLFWFGVFILVNFILYRAVHSRPKRRRFLGRALVVGYIILAILVTASSLLGWFLNYQYETKYRPFTAPEITELLRTCKITSITDENASWKRVHLKSGESRSVLWSDLEEAQEEAGQAACDD